MGQTGLSQNQSATGPSAGRGVLFSRLSEGLSRSSIPGLDGMRALAVFLVIFFHFGINGVPGGLGVLGFFVLSGFLITWLLLKENQMHGRISLKNFYMRRVLRIFPAFYVYWFACVAFLLVTHKLVPWRHAFFSFFYLGDYYNAIVRPPDSFVSHTWSLAIEEQFYLLWPALLVMFRNNLERLTRVLLGIIVFTWLYRLFLVFVVHINQSYIYNAFDTRMDHLLVGCLLAVLLFRGALNSLWKALCARVYYPAFTIALIVLSSVLAAHYSYAYRDTIGFTVDPLLVGILLVQFVNFGSKGAWSWINWSWIRYLGRISYSLYLYQEMTLYPARRVLANHSILIQLIAAVLGTVIVASGSYYIIERPFLRLKARFETDRPSRTVAAAAAVPG